MRVIAGKYKGRRLICPNGWRIRPIPSRLKESLFSVLSPWLDGARVLDLCAGTGAVGIESLSRGAIGVTFVESWGRAIDVLRHNLAACGIESNTSIIPSDVVVTLKWLAERGDEYDLVFFDPPYASDLYQPVLDALGRGTLLAADAQVLVMHHSKRSLEERYGVIRRHRQLKQGENVLSFYARSD